MSDFPNFNSLVLGILSNPSNSSLYSGLYTFLNNYADPAKKCKILLALDDGTVIVDTSKDNTVNTYSNFTDGSVNVNHNSRPEIINALLNSSGVSSSVRFSTSTSSSFQYYAVRLGNSPQAPLGTIRIAFQSTLL